MSFKIYARCPELLPRPAQAGESGMDLMADVPERVFLKPGERMLVPTGVYTQLPEGYELQVRPRSGLALKHGITVVNSPGTVDSSYRGEIGVILMNTDPHKEFSFIAGDRIAQAVIQKVEHPQWQAVESVEELSQTERGAGGYGSTGVSALYQTALNTLSSGPKGIPGTRDLSEELRLLAVVEDRIRTFQPGPLSNRANELALQHVESAVKWLKQRGADVKEETSQDLRPNN